MTAVVYEYGCQAPVKGDDLLATQMSLAHRYHNRLIELERDRRAACEGALREVAAYAGCVARVEALEAELEAVREQIARAKQAAQRDVETRTLDAEAKRLRGALREARAERRSALAEAREAQREILERCNDEAAQARRDARKASGLYWGTYLVVEQAAQAACGGPTLHFARWDGSGHVAVQVQRTRPLTTDGVFGDDTRVQIDPLAPDAYDHPSRGERRRRQRTAIRVRIGSAADRSPIWCELPVILHRPLPAGRVTWVHLLRERVEAKDRYRVQLVIESDGPPLERCGTGVVGVDLGWRLTPEGLRVAYAAGSDGAEHVLVQRADVGAAVKHAEGLRGTRDDNLTAIRVWLVAWLAGREVPEWLAEARKTLPLWRSQARLAGLVLRWRSQRWEGDAEGYERLEAWRKQDKHLWTWEVHERRRTLGRRREQYRVWAAGLARRYEVLVLEDFDLRDVAKQRPAEEDKDTQESARYQRVIAAPSTARAALVNAFRQRGGIVIAAPAEFTTQMCHACGKRCRWDQAAEITHTCEHCGARWDQDRNAALTLRAYASGEVVSSAREALASATPRIGRFQRRAATAAQPLAEESSEVLAEAGASAQEDK